MEVHFSFFSKSTLPDTEVATKKLRKKTSENEFFAEHMSPDIEILISLLNFPGHVTYVGTPTVSAC